MQKLLEFCRTPRETEIIQAWIDAGAPEHGSGVKAASAVGISERRFLAVKRKVVYRATQDGYEPPKHAEHIPEGHVVTGQSTLVGPDGETPLLTWVKTALDKDKAHEALINALDEIAERYAAVAKPAPAPKRKLIDDCITVYPIGDPHVGMYAWHMETGEDYDSEIAERDLLAAADNLVAKAPPTEECVICNLGDFFHFDTYEQMTGRSGHHLDGDTRWSKVLDTGIAIMVGVIARALRKHERVTVVNKIGNHDTHSGLMLIKVLGAWYRNEPRIEVVDDPGQYTFRRFGKNLLGFTHGDKGMRGRTPNDLVHLMAVDRAEDWGETTHRMWMIGHVHQKNVWEIQGVKVESFRTLAAKDAWHHAEGYRAGRDMHAIVFHKEYGEIERHRCDIALARAE